MNWNESYLGLITALSIGLLIGTVRERLHKPGPMKAGVRTHGIVALLGAITFGMGPQIFIATLLVAGFMIAVGYHQTAQDDPGMTGEFTLLLNVVVSGLAMHDPSLAAAIGVVVAGLLFVKKPLRHFSQEILTEQELKDALMLCAAALVALPLLPAEAIDPWNALKPYVMWKIVVLIMGVGMLGHIAMRASGVTWGLPLAGFFSGFISSTAAVAEFGRKTKSNPELAEIASAAALLATLSSLMLFVLVLVAVSPGLVVSLAWPLTAAGIVLALVSIYLIRDASNAPPFELPSTDGAFQISHALMIAAIISTVSLCSAWLRTVFGDSGTLATAVVVGLVEIQAAAVGIAQLSPSHAEPSATARWGVVSILGASVCSKVLLAYLSGGRAYGTKIATGLILCLVAAVTGMLLVR
jgi:uncharacterized membrane protein (DUF4010 family)